MSAEGMPGKQPATERWRVTGTTLNGSTNYDSFVVVHYDERGVTEITREALSALLTSAGAECVEVRP